MLSRTAWPVSWLLFRACVALKQVMAAKKKPPVRRVRKGIKLRTTLLVIGLCGLNGLLMADPAVIAVSDQAGHLKNDNIQPVCQLNSSILPPTGELPPDSAQLRFGEAPVIEAGTFTGRDWMNYGYFWQASALCHRPIYLEERAVERAGFRAGYGLQPAVSATHFVAGLSALPVRVALQPPWRCEYTLGQERPGTRRCSR